MSVRREKRKDRNGRVQYFWRVDVDLELPDGTRRRIRKISPVQTRRGAEEYERELRRAILNGDREQEEVPTLKKFLEKFMSTYASINNKPSERKAKECVIRLHLNPKLGHMKLNEIDSYAVEKFKAEQKEPTTITLKNGKLKEKTLSNKSVNNQLTVLRTALNVAEEWGVIKHAPKIKLLPVTQAEVDFLDFDEAQRLLEAAQAEPDWYSMVVVALNCGLRIGELIALMWDDIDLVARRLTVSRSDWQGHVGPPKGKKSRTIPLNDLVVSALKAHRHLRGPRVWCQENGSTLDKDHPRPALRRIRRRAGLRHFEWHCLRHTFASHLVMRGIPIRVVQELLGHQSIEMTMRYAHLSPEIGAVAVDALRSRRHASGHIAAKRINKRSRQKKRPVNLSD